MLTRPLELSSRLRPPLKSFEFLFYINGGLIALFFVLFGSRFVLSPGLRVNGVNLILPSSPSAKANATRTTLVLSISASEQIFVDSGIIRSTAQLREWLTTQARNHPGAMLLVKADEATPARVIARISALVDEVGLAPLQWALQSPATSEWEPTGR